MNTEQKAKAYDEAIERAKRMFSDKEIDYLFPELRESEDEKIREAIIQFFELQDDNTTYSFIPKKDIIAWLEKQKTSNEALQYLKENHSPSEMSDFQAAMNIAVVKAFDAGKKQGEQKLCMIQWKGDNLKEVIGFTGKDKNFDKWFKSFEEYEKYVHEHNDIFKLFNEDGSHYEVPIGAWIVKTPDGYNVASKAVLKQKTIDRVKLKFKVGDLVKYTNHNKQPIYKVNYIDKECYICISDDATLGDKAIMHFAFDNPYLRLVEQKPADKVEPKFKAGDWAIFNGLILHIDEVEDGVYKTTSLAGIHDSYDWEIDKIARRWAIQDAKEGYTLSWDDSNCIALFKNIYNENSFSSYGFVGHCTGIFECKNAYHSIEGVHPATKQQRELLFQKMKEAGYTWDAEKKELKKIEQNPANWLQELEDKLVNATPKQLAEWKEKYFKEEPAEWSEQDERIYNSITYSFAHNYPLTVQQQEFVKSLKERYTWKPSDEQMKQLGWIAEQNKNNLIGKELMTLYEELKKLK